MTVNSLRQVTQACLACAALISQPALGAEFTVSTPTLLKNGDPGHVLDGNDGLTITASGSITTDATPATDATGTNNTIFNWGNIVTTGFAYGARIIDASTVFNAGSIVTSAALADAIHATNANIITNSGTISTAGLNAWAINFQNNNTVTNSGTINTTGDGARAISGNDSNTIINSGTLATTGNTSDGIEANDFNTVTNSGSISTGGSSSIGISVANNNKVTNSGSLTTSGSDASALFGSGFNTVVNSGSISTSGSGSAAIFLLSNNTIFNTGSIKTTGLSYAGILFLFDNTITNSGSVETTRDSATGISGWSNNTITNSGSIETKGDSAFGIYGWGGNTITNSGSIETSGNAASAIDLVLPGNTVTNSGKVVSSQADAFRFAPSDSQLNLLAPAFIGGTIDMGTSNTVDITTGRSHSSLWTFGGNPVSIAIAGPVPWAWNGATKQFATLDPTAFSASFNMLADTTASLSNLSRANTQKNWWMQGYGNFTEYGAEGIFNDYASMNGAIAIGANFAPSSQLKIGVFAGYQRTMLNVNSRWVTSQTITGDNTIAGLTGSVQMENFFAEFALLGGFGTNSSDRFVNDNLQPLGEDNALASYDSFFIAPELRIGVNVDAGGDWVVTPSASARFSNQWIAGYTETGSIANAIVAARQVQVFEGGLELAAIRQFQTGALTLFGGAQYRQALGASTQNITLLGQTLALPLNTDGMFIGYVGADAGFEIGDMSMLELAAKASFGANSFFGLSGSVGWNSEF